MLSRAVLLLGLCLVVELVTAAPVGLPMSSVLGGSVGTTSGAAQTVEVYIDVSDVRSHTIIVCATSTGRTQMHMLGSFSDQMDHNYPTNETAQFTDVDGAGGLLTTNPFDYGAWDTDRCLFVNATAKQRYLLVSLTWTPLMAKFDAKYWINAEVPEIPNWDAERVFLDATYNLTIMQRKWFYRDPKKASLVQTENLRLSIDRCGLLQPDEASAAQKIAVASGGILSYSWRFGNTTNQPILSTSDCFKGPKREQAQFDSYFSMAPQGVASANCAAVQIEASDNGGKNLPSFFFARLRYGYMSNDQLSIANFLSSSVRVRLSTAPNYKDGGARDLLPIRYDSSLLITMFEPPIYDQQFAAYDVYWSSNVTGNPMASFLRNSLCYIQQEMNSSLVKVERALINSLRPQATLTVPDAFPTRYTSSDSALVVVANYQGVVYVYDQTQGPQSDSFPNSQTREPEKWPTVAIAVCAGLAGACVFIFIALTARIFIIKRRYQYQRLQ